MKKLITGVAILMASFAGAQIKEASITYDMKIEGLPAEQAAMMGDMQMKKCFKDKKVYIESSSMMFNTKTVTDENGALLLIDQMGNKQFIRMTKADLDKKAAENKGKEAKIEYVNETKTIATYECKKAVITSVSPKDGEVKMDVWYTEKLPYVSDSKKMGGSDPMANIKGMPLEYITVQGPAKIKFTAKEISFDKIPDSKFVLSTEGYTEVKNLPGQPK
jgi:GLPGLI family protein